MSRDFSLFSLWEKNKKKMKKCGTITARQPRIHEDDYKLNYQPNSSAIHLTLDFHIKIAGAD